MKKAVIVDAVRTPMGKSKQGLFRHVRAEDLSAHLMRTLLQRQKQIDPAKIDDIIWGCVQQTLEQCYNIGRNAQLLTDIPQTVSAQTVNRLCGSSMTAIHLAAQAIMSGEGDIFLCGGVEHMGHVSMYHGVDFNPKLSLTTSKGAGSMGMTAELLGRLHKISRSEQDAFASLSHAKAHEATRNGSFKNEIAPLMGHDEAGLPQLCVHDEVIRPETTVDTLSKLPPVFDPLSGTVTAGNSSALSDGAAAVWILSEEMAKNLGLKPLARIVSMAATGCEPSIMGFGPVSATHKALKKAQLQFKDIDIVELNEAFAAQALPVLRTLGIDTNDEQVMRTKVNPYGGAIALGHPLGCSGARITGSLAHQLRNRNKRYGLATMCIGLGQGVATIIEAMN